MLRCTFSRLLVVIAASMVVASLNSIASAVVVTGGTGPGGVGTTTGAASGLKLWLQPGAGNFTYSSGSNVSSWLDNSGSGNTMTAPVGFEPVQVTPGSGFNGQSVVQFDSIDYLQKTSFIGLTSQSGATSFAVLASANASDNRIAFVGETNTSTSTFPRVQHFTTGSPSQPRWLAGSANTIWRYGDGTQVVNNQTTIHTSIFDGTQGVPDDRLSMKIDGTEFPLLAGSASSFATTTGTTNNVALGRWINNNPTNNFIGNVAEAIIFNTTLSEAQVTIVENYLSAKYNKAIDPATNKYTGDTLYDYDSGVFGVGRGTVDTTAFSSSGAAGFGIEATGGLDAGEYVLAGHNGIANSVIDLEGGVNVVGQRWSRVWNVDTNGGTVDATVGFNFINAGNGGDFDAGDSFQLLYSSDETFDSWQITPFTATIGLGNTIEFDLAGGFLQSGFYTLGINAGVVPEPGTGLLLLTGMLALRKRRRGSRK